MSMQYPMDSSRIHLMTIKGSKYVLDVNSTVFFEVDDLAHEILQNMCKVSDESQIVENLATNYPREEVIAQLQELTGLVARNELFSKDRFNSFQPDSAGPLGMICLNISHICNLSCKYCFANRDGYTRDAKLMTKETAEKAVDFLISSSRNRNKLEVSFFGGEPLLNLPVMMHTVAYAKEQGKIHKKNIQFHVTTNGTLMRPEILDFLKENNFSIILSLDGPKEVQDSIRQFPDGRGSYDIVSNNLKQLLAERQAFRHLTVRSTFTRESLSIEKLMTHLGCIGCDSISVEPAFIGPGHPLDIRKEDMDELLNHYDILAGDYLGEMLNGKCYSFFHIKLMMDHAHKKKPKVSQCGAAVGYVAIGADGKIYPCHKFVGKPEFVMGDVFNGLTDTKMKKMFAEAHVRNKSKCMQCWARYICGGSCHYLAILYNGDIRDPYGLECEMTKRRIELGVHTYVRLRNENPENYQNFYGGQRPHLENIN